MKKYKIESTIEGNFGHLYQKYPIDLDDYRNKYGFGLNKTEINEIYYHIQALEDFLSSSDTHALIYETIQQPNFIEDKFPLSDTNDWNFILLQQEISYNYLPQQGYRLGYKWADMNYLVSREGAITILDHINSLINQPYSDIILDLLLDEKLTEFVLGDDGFDFDKKPLYYDKSKNQEILSTIFKIDRWSLDHKEKARKLLNIVFDESRKLNIELFINEGTLLGCIRHREIMPWDDDIDLAMSSEDITVLLESLKQNEEIEIGTSYFYGRHLYYKIWLRECDEIQGYAHKFPFIDIWPFEIVDSQLRYNFGYSYSLEDIFPLSDCRFEDVIVKIPKNPLAYLHTRYPNWNEKIIVFPYCHRIEKRKGKLLEAYITVNKMGNIETNCLMT